MVDGELAAWWGVLGLLVVSGLGALVALLFIAAPFGKFANSAWGPLLDGKLSWGLFEAIPLAAFWTSLLVGVDARSLGGVQWAVAGLFSLHYINRSLVYTVRAPAIAPIPLVVSLAAAAFNSLNGYANGRWVSVFGDGVLKATKPYDPRFLVGLVMFGVGMWINISSDNILFALRRKRTRQQAEAQPQGETQTQGSVEHAADAAPQKGRGYSIPRGGLFELVSCPHYFGEFVEWAGFAIAAASPAGAVFVFFTMANLVPRALKQHAWYRETFGDQYPANRKAVFPYVL
ncbi:hypothetical protein HK105_200865 [Polyrhizophydium stewartii]|uniref:3-oxo-5-alpha-steroid 4-dehydrogenase C-terminal domain-containing protein n=1 Tax=Polyrhizophydium stewartii TaxID=2732419 RepID=A0ABR4NI60_9FUNG